MIDIELMLKMFYILIVECIMGAVNVVIGMPMIITVVYMMLCLCVNTLIIYVIMLSRPEE